MYLNSENLYQYIKAKIDKEPGERCIKQQVGAMIRTSDGMEIFGSNNINKHLEKCPRDEQNFKSGEGYHLCKEICNQNSHAEITAINKALSNKINIVGSTLFLIGHTYCCDNCLSFIKLNKISKVFVLSENDLLKEYSDCLKS